MLLIAPEIIPQYNVPRQFYRDRESCSNYPLKLNATWKIILIIRLTIKIFLLKIIHKME